MHSIEFGEKRQYISATCTQTIANAVDPKRKHLGFSIRTYCRSKGSNQIQNVKFYNCCARALLIHLQQWFQLVLKWMNILLHNFGAMWDFPFLGGQI